jgi:hypothetical protein
MVAGGGETCSGAGWEMCACICGNMVWMYRRRRVAGRRVKSSGALRGMGMQKFYS